MELYRHRFAGVAEEMGGTLRRAAYSPNIKERLDFSCAVFDAQGQTIAQAAHIPVHLGAMPASVRAALDACSNWAPGDVVILNDPYQGGTHLPDLTMISPVFAAGVAAPLFFVASRAHHADVGGMTPGSLPLSTELYQEGIVIPPVRLYRAGVVNADLLELILRNVRTPGERRGDLAAQRAAHAIGERRLQELVDQHGKDEVTQYGAALQTYSEHLTRAAIATWPDGSYEFEDTLEVETSQGWSTASIRLRATISGDQITFDFAGTDPAMPNSLNAVQSITASACYYVVRCLLDTDAPMNAGLFAPIKVVAPAGCLVNARPPAAVAGGNVETSQRIVDTAFGALANALPERIPAASQGTMNNLTVGGFREDGSPFAYYETIAGGMGAGPGWNGIDGTQVHMTNTLNTPVEALELDVPFRVEQYSLRTGSGGKGAYCGGDGIIREYTFLEPATVTMLSERRQQAPWGLSGGGDGTKGRNVYINTDGAESDLPPKFSRRFEKGERLRIETPGGGGFGH